VVLDEMILFVKSGLIFLLGYCLSNN